MMFRVTQLVVTAFACTALTACAAACHASPREPISTNICAVLSEPSDWNNKTVSFSASYYDNFYHAVLVDNHCDDSPLEVEIAWGSNARRELDAALSEDPLGTFGNAVTGTWVGRFHSDYGKFHGRFLEVRAVTNLSVSPIDFSISDASPILTTVGEIVSHPKALDHKTVVFRSEFLSDGMHGSIVFECGPSGVEAGISIRSTLGAKGEEALDRALQQGYRGTLDKRIQAEWTGRLVWFPSPVSAKYEIQIIEIKNLTVSMHPLSVPCETDAASVTAQKP